MPFWEKPGRIAVLDTFVAFTSGLIIFLHVSPSESIRIRDLAHLCHLYRNRFNAMAEEDSGELLFFLFMAFASLSTVLAVFENIIACFMDKWNMSAAKHA